MADLNIIAIHPKTRRVTFSFNVLPAQARGMEALLQLCIKTVLTSPGFDTFRPEYGGGVLGFLKMGLSVSDVPKISADISYAVSRAERQILEEQETCGEEIPLSERLRSMKVISIVWDKVFQTLDARILVTSATGESSDVSLANQIRIK